MSTPVTIIDYGLGNLHSVCKAIVRVGGEPAIVTHGDQLADAGHVILPGVGAFADGMRGLHERGFVAALRAHVAAERPLAGICLGMQLLFDESDEFGVHAGLGIIPGRVERIPEAGVKVPHVGWNRVVESVPGTWVGSALDGLAQGSWAYFVHSYHARPRDPGDVLALTRHGPHQLTAAVRHGSATGFQYHPEKSGADGLATLRRFVLHSCSEASSCCVR